MLRLIRRHVKACPHTSSRFRRCSCPIHAYGTLAGEKVRRALDLTSWEAASDLIRDLDASRQIGVVEPEVPGFSAARSAILTASAHAVTPHVERAPIHVRANSGFQPLSAHT